MTSPVKPFRQTRTGRKLNRLVDAANALLGLVGDQCIQVASTERGYSLRLNINAVRQRLGRDQLFWARLTDSSDQGGGHWRYAWEEVEWNGDSVAVKSGGRSGTLTENYAINALETAHTGTIIWGVDTAGADYPSGFSPQPVQTGATLKMREETDKSGDIIYRFEAMGQHDGACS